VRSIWPSASSAIAFVEYDEPGRRAGFPTQIVQGRSGLRACSHWKAGTPGRPGPWKAGTQLVNKMVPLVRQVMKRTGALIFCGNTRSEASSSGCSNLRIFGAPRCFGPRSEYSPALVQNASRHQTRKDLR
jgi:hypothetical protein